MNGRRGFLLQCLALAAAPAIVRADSLMRIVPVETTVVPAEQFLAVDVGTEDDTFVIFVHSCIAEEMAALSISKDGLGGLGVKVIAMDQIYQPLEEIVPSAPIITPAMIKAIQSIEQDRPGLPPNFNRGGAYEKQINHIAKTAKKGRGGYPLPLPYNPRMRR